MRTTEVFVEQVLIGVLLLAAVFALADPELFRQQAADADWESLVLLGAAAYLVGIVYDRVGDTLVETLDKHHRLLFALREQARLQGSIDPTLAADPFPEDCYRMLVLASGEASDYAHYLRTRMRLTRALATLAPGLSVAAGALLVDDPARARLIGLVVGGYTLAFAVKLIPGRELGSPWRPTPVRLPRTTELTDEDTLNAYRELVRLPPGGRRSRLPSWTPLVLVRESSVWLAVLLALGAAFSVLGQPAEGRWMIGGPWLLPPLGLLLAFVFGWAWWRITGTYRAFLRDFYRWRPTAAPPSG